MVDDIDFFATDAATHKNKKRIERLERILDLMAKGYSVQDALRTEDEAANL